MVVANDLESVISSLTGEGSEFRERFAERNKAQQKLYGNAEYWAVVAYIKKNVDACNSIFKANAQLTPLFAAVKTSQDNLNKRKQELEPVAYANMQNLRQIAQAYKAYLIKNEVVAINGVQITSLKAVIEAFEGVQTEQVEEMAVSA